MPRDKCEDVVTRLCLKLCRNRQRQFVALRSYEIDLNVNFVLIGPLIDHSLEASVCTRRPMIPDPNGQLSRCVRRTDEWRRHACCDGGAKKMAA
jgi:hypothetical protein